MSKKAWYIVGGVGLGILALVLLPFPIDLIVFLALIGAPVAGYLLLDPSQRKRLLSQGKKRIGN